MQRLQIERHEVRVFHAVVTHQGFSRAAEHLSLSQSAVSQTMANLEHKLGTRLLSRKRKPVLTEAGQRLIGYAELVLAEEQQALHDIEQIRTGALSTLSLATNSMVNRYFTGPLLLKFCQDNPLTRMKLDVIPSKEIIKGVAEGRWELGFGPFQTHMPAHLNCRVYFEEKRVLAVHRNHPDYSRLMTNPADALGDAVLLTSYLDDVLKPANAARLSAQFKAVWEVSHLDLRLALAEAGRGITYLSDRILADEENMHAMTRLEATNIPRQVGIYYRKDQPLSAGAARFVALCDNHFQSTRA